MNAKTGTHTITLPKPFVNGGTYSVNLTGASGHDVTTYVAVLHSTYFTFQARSNSRETVSIFWTAIGFWK